MFIFCTFIYEKTKLKDLLLFAVGSQSPSIACVWWWCIHFPLSQPSIFKGAFKRLFSRSMCGSAGDGIFILMAVYGVCWVVAILKFSKEVNQNRNAIELRRIGFGRWSWELRKNLTNWYINWKYCFHLMSNATLNDWKLGCCFVLIFKGITYFVRQRKSTVLRWH